MRVENKQIKILEASSFLLAVFWDKLINMILLGLILLFGLSVRLYNLGSHNLWFDEFLSFYFAKFVNLKGLVAVDFHPPFYFIVLKAWMPLFGTSEFALRLLSMLPGVLSIFVIYKLGKLIFNEKTGLFSAFILSMSPIHIWYSQEARGYSLLVFLTLVSVYYLLSALKRSKPYKWLIFVSSSILALYTSYFFIFILIISSIPFSSNNFRPLLKRFLICLCVITVAIIPYYPLFLKQISRISDSFWLFKPNLNSLRFTFENFSAGYNSTLQINLFVSIVFSTLFFIGVLCWWKKKGNELLLLILLAFAPIISVFLVSQKMPIYLDRQLLLFSPFYYIIISAGIERVKIRAIKIFICFAISIPLLFCLKNYFTNRMPLPQAHHIGVFLKTSAKPAADYIISGLEKKDIVAISEKCSADIFYYLIPHISTRQVAFFYIEENFKHEKNIYNYKKIKYDQLYRLQNRLKSYIFQLEGKPTIPGIRNTGELQCERIWLVSSSWLRDGVLGEHAKAVREYMQRHYESLDHKELGGIIIDLYGQRKD